MQFKDETVAYEFLHTPLLLRMMVDDFNTLSMKCGIEPMVTRVKEHIEGDSGVHEQNRAVDIRQEHPPGVLAYDFQQQNELLVFINEKYRRNDGKPSMICHRFGQGMLHFHLQIANFTNVYVP